MRNQAAIASSTLQVSGLNHFNITASQQLLEDVKQFYTDVVGLRLGPRAQLDHSGYWLYAGALPIVHLSALPDTDIGMDAGTNASTSDRGELAACRTSFNHISLNCSGLSAAIHLLNCQSIPYKVIELPDIGQTQIFVKDPAGIGVELTFFDEYL